MNTLTIRRPDDFHVHLRRDERMPVALPHSWHFGRLLVMPNTTPPILNWHDATLYVSELCIVRKEEVDDEKWPFLMTIKATQGMTWPTVKRAHERGVTALKFYPDTPGEDSVTTGSKGGVCDFFSDNLLAVYNVAQRCGLVCSFHGELADPTVHPRDRERLFLTTLIKIHEMFPRLRIVLEHVSCKEAVELIASMPNNVAATITAHHLFITEEDNVDPHNRCMPTAKTREDRAAIRQAAFSGNPSFFFGSDSAPHWRAAKENTDKVASGCFTAPVAISLLATIFETSDHIDRLEDFVSAFGAGFYGFRPNKDTITLVREPWIVPDEYEGIVPFWHGQEIPWKVQE
ncbi:MAG: dihydroorotase [bacterium]